ncbi:unnamed protein product [Toxocara canis]|uniref:Peptidase C1A papain C-terminal domain-containing protein n=1 Tax=Toxocara canis TaxID=6265 RepID=A0A3P7H3X7_TOXCA|nr:unnamed protein product [Toxocara canis]
MAASCLAKLSAKLEVLMAIGGAILPKKFKAKYNPFGTRKRDFNFPYDKNATAIEEYVDRLSEFFASEKMKTHIRELTEFPVSSLPSEFDAREKWSYCSSLHNVPNQGSCGSCYVLFGPINCSLVMQKEFQIYFKRSVPCLPYSMFTNCV